MGCLRCACHISPSHPLHARVSSAVFAVPARSLRDHIPVCTVFAGLHPIRKRGSSALPHERRGVWPPGRSRALHRLWAQRVRQDYFCRRRHDAHQRSELRYRLWLLENHTREHWTVRCFHNVRGLCFARFSQVKAKTARIGKPLLDRGRERRKKRCCDQCCRVDVQEKSTEQYLESFFSDSQRVLILRTRSPRIPGTKSSTSRSWWKFRSERMRFDWVRPGDSELRAKKFRICADRVATRAWISKTTVTGSQSIGRSSSAWENTLA